MSGKKQEWDADEYSEHASFVPELGVAVLDLLNPKEGERILDLGCGDGSLSLKIQSHGADVLGIDSSPEMIASAKSKGINAQVLAAESISFKEDFDAVFSNAALHWIKDYERVIGNIFKSLKKGGRFIGEFGGHGNIQTIANAIEECFKRHPDFGTYEYPWFFPSDEMYKEALESVGFEVSYIELIQRPTPLESGITEWLKIFADFAIFELSEEQKYLFFNDVEKQVRHSLYSEKQGWHADYVRLRFCAYNAKV